MGQFDHIANALRASPLTAAFMEMAETGDFSRLDKNQAKRQHFVPQLLLRGFSHPFNDKPYVFQMETGSRRAPRRVDVRAAASRHRLYAVPDEAGELSNRNEGYLALVEDHAAQALRRLLDDPKSLSPGDRATIAMFVALQTMRTPAAAKQMVTVANAAFRMAVTEFNSDRHAFAESYRSSHGDEVSDEEIEQFRQEMIAQVRDGRLRVGGEAAALSTGLIQAIEKVPLLFEFDWTLLQAPTGGFMTSDRGFAIHDPTPQFPWAWQALLSSDTTETTVPLSDTACLLMRPLLMRGGLTVREASARDVETINLRTFGWADEYVFGKTQDTLVAVRLASRQRPADVIRPKPFSEVVLIEADPDDNSLIEMNLRKRGHPPRLRQQGRVFDYVVIPSDQPHPELWALVEEVAERRARTRAGSGLTNRLNGGSSASCGTHSISRARRGQRQSGSRNRAAASG
jgi:hypothetical protein